MEKIPVTNNTDATIFVGGKMITAGETRHFFAHELPPEYQENTQTELKEDVPVDPLEEIRSQSVRAITSLLPNLKIEELQGLEELENNQESPRSSLLSAISAELLKRAAQKDKQDLLNSIPTLNKEDLEALKQAEEAKGVAADADIIAAIDVALEKFESK